MGGFYENHSKIAAMFLTKNHSRVMGIVCGKKVGFVLLVYEQSGYAVRCIAFFVQSIL